MKNNKRKYETNGKLEVKRTPSEFCKELGLRIDNYNGVFTTETFCDKSITLDEFLNLASQCVISFPLEKNRRAAFELKKKLTKKIDKY
jgi:hypothetical protein